MILKKEELMQKLEDYVGAFLLYRDCLNSKEQDFDQMQMALEAYTMMLEELSKFVIKTYDEESFPEPNMRVYFNNDDFEFYDDITYRIYAAVWNMEIKVSKEKWTTFVLVYIAELLRSRLL